MAPLPLFSLGEYLLPLCALFHAHIVSFLDCYMFCNSHQIYADQQSRNSLNLHIHVVVFDLTTTVVA